MITPTDLKKGDMVGIIAPAKQVLKKEIDNAVKVFESWGLKVKIGKHALKTFHQFAGTDEERAADLQEMLNDKNVKAIICARGGYGTIRILEKVNFYALVRMPKWIVGYSDITILHTVLNHHMSIETIHGTMPINYPVESRENDALISLRKILFGEKPHYSIPYNSLNIIGKTEGTLVGGNLSVLHSLAGTRYDMDTEGKILFLEDLDEYLYHIDRMMMNMKLAGKLEKLRGIIVGVMSDIHDNKVPFGKTAYEIIKDIVSEYNIPLAFNFPAGHIDNNLTLIMGRHVTMKVDNTQTVIKFT